MASSYRKLFFGPEDLAILQRVFDLASADLQISPCDRTRREWLATLLFALAQRTPCSPVRLRRRLVLQFCATVSRSEGGRASRAVAGAIRVGYDAAQRGRVLSFRGPA